MCIDLSSTETAMSQKLLDTAKVSPAIEHMGGEGVAESMWADGWVQIGLGQVFIELSPDAAGAEPLAGLVHEQGLLCSFIGSVLLLSLGEVFCNKFQSSLAGWGQSLSASFTPDVKDSLVKIDVGYIQAHQLADADPGGVDDLEHSQVAQAQEGASIRCAEKGLDLVLLEELGQTFFLLGSADDSNRAGLQISPADQEFIERSQGSQFSGGSGPGIVFVVEDYEKFANGRGGYC